MKQMSDLIDNIHGLIKAESLTTSTVENVVGPGTAEQEMLRITSCDNFIVLPYVVHFSAE